MLTAIQTPNASRVIGCLDKITTQFTTEALKNVTLPLWARNACIARQCSQGTVLKWIPPRRTSPLREFTTSSLVLRKRDGTRNKAPKSVVHIEDSSAPLRSTQDSSEGQDLERFYDAEIQWRPIISSEKQVKEVRKKFQIPEASQYPESATFVRWLFAGSEASYIPEFTRWLENHASVQTVFSDGEQHWRCSISYPIPGNDSAFVTSSGHAEIRHQAEGIARLSFGAILLEKNLLSRILPVTDEDMSVRLERHVNYNGVLLPVYEYAARYLLVPEVIHEPVLAILQGQDTVLIRVSIRLPEQDINVTALHSNERVAEISAALRFREAARERWQRDGEQDMGYLSSKTAPSFLRSFRAQYPTSGLSFTFPTSKDVGGAIITTPQANCWGKQLVEPFKLRGTLLQARRAAQLVAAVKLARQNPKVWAKFEGLDVNNQGNPMIPMLPLPFVPQGSSIFLLRKFLAYVHGASSHSSHQEPRAGTSMSAEGNTIATEIQSAVPVVDHKSHAPINHSSQLKRERSKSLLERQAIFEDDESFSYIRSQRESLPIMRHSEEVLRHVHSSTVSVIYGETGSGKTTQVPQVIFDAAVDRGDAASCNIICTQPRRIAATSVAERVARERGEQVGESVGWHIRGENREVKLPGSINYITTGILLKKLQHQPESVMDEISHIVLDEAHERSCALDYVLIALRELMRQRQTQGRPNPRIIIMSATLNSSIYSRYFSYNLPDGSTNQVPIMNITGRTFPVRTFHLDHVLENVIKSHGLQQVVESVSKHPSTSNFLRSELQFLQEESSIPLSQTLASFLSHRRLQASRPIAEDSIIKEEYFDNREEDRITPPSYLASLVIAHIIKTMPLGAILVFLPGLKHIDQVAAQLQNTKPFGVPFINKDRYRIMRLHSELEAEDSVFEPVSDGQWKIILATNIAESSITIPDIKYVVDSGLMRKSNIDPFDRFSELRSSWVSKSSARQRRGRAGRVQKGYLFALYSQARFETFQETPVPELLVADLQATCLDVVTSRFGVPVRDFLGKAIEPPDVRRIDQAMIRLVEVDAITKDEKVTTLGRLLSQLFLPPSLARLAVLGLVFRCLDPLLILAALSTMGQSSILRPSHDSDGASTAKHWELSPESQSDHLVCLKAFCNLQYVFKRSGRKAAKEFASINSLNWSVYEKVSKIIEYCRQVLTDDGLILAHALSSTNRQEVGGDFFNQNSDKHHLIRSLLLSGFQSNIAVRMVRQWRTARQESISISSSSVLNLTNPQSFRAHKWRELSNKFRLATFEAVHRTPGLGHFVLHRATIIPPMAACLFSGSLHLNSDAPRAKNETHYAWEPDTNLEDSRQSPGRAQPKSSLICDGWLPLLPQSEDAYAARIIFDTRQALQRMLLMAYDDLSAKKPMNLSLYQTHIEVFSELLRVEWEALLAEDHLEHTVSHKEVTKQTHITATGRGVWDDL